MCIYYNLEFGGILKEKNHEIKKHENKRMACEESWYEQ